LSLFKIRLQVSASRLFLQSKTGKYTGFDTEHVVDTYMFARLDERITKFNT